MTSVDNRVVQMEFDDSKFDSRINRAIESIERLDKSLILKNGVKGLEGIQKAVSQFSPSGMISGLKSVASNFIDVNSAADSTVSKLGSIAVSINGIIALSNSLGGTIKNLLMQGGFQRALNIEQASWKMKNLGMNVKALNEDIDYAVSGTRFGFDEAANAAAQFGASGIKAGEQMKIALRSVSGVATMTNSEYASIADIFTKIASNGKVMTMELRQISSRGLNAAKALADFYKTTESNIYEMVSKGEISFDDFAKAMDQAFGEASTKANETFSGSLANMKAAVKRIGAEVAAPVIKNARKIFVNVIPLVNKINNTFKTASDGMYKTVNKKKLSKSIKEALDKTGSYVTKTGVTYEKVGNKYKKFIDSTFVKNPSEAVKRGLKNSTYFVAKNGQVYKKVITQQGSVIRKMRGDSTSLFGQIRRDITMVQKAINSFLTGLLKGVGSNDNPIVNYARAMSNSLLALRSVIIGISNVLKPFYNAVKKALSPLFDSKVVLSFSESLYYLANRFEEFTRKSKPFRKVLNILAKIFAGKLSRAVKFLLIIWKNFMAIIGQGTGKLSKYIENLLRDSSSLESVLNKFLKKHEHLRNGIDNLQQAARNFVETFDFIKTKFKSLTDSIVKPWQDLFEQFTAPLEKIDSESIKEFRKLIDMIGSLFNSGDKKKKSDSGLGAAFESITEGILHFSEAVNQFVKSEGNVEKFENLSKLLSGISSTLAGGAFKVLEGALWIINPLLKNFYKFLSFITSLSFESVAEFFKSLFDFSSIEIDFTFLNGGFESVSNAIKNIYESIKNGEPFLEKFKNVLTGVARKVKNLFDSFAGSNPMLHKVISGLGNGLKNLWDRIDSFISNNAPKIKAVFESFLDLIKTNVIPKIVEFGRTLGTTISDVVSNLPIFENINDLSLDDFLESLKILGGELHNFLDNLEIFKDPFKAFKSIIEDIVNAVSSLKGLFGVNETKQSNDLVQTVIGDPKEVTQTLKEVNSVTRETSSLLAGLVRVKGDISDVKSIFDDFTSSFTQDLGKIEDQFVDTGESIEESITDFGDTSKKLKSLLSIGLAGAITVFSVKFIKGIGFIGKGLKETVKMVGKTVKAFKTIPDTITEVKDIVKSKVKYTSLLKIAASITLIALSLKMISTIDPKAMAASVRALLISMGALLGFLAVFKKLNPKTIASVTKVFLAFAGSMALLSASIFLLSLIEPLEIALGLITILTLTASMLAIFKLLEPKLAIVGSELLKFAAAIGILVLELGLINAMPVDFLARGLFRMELILGELALFFGALKLLNVEQMEIVVKRLGITILELTMAVMILGTIDSSKIGQGLKAMGAMLLELAGFMALMKLIQSFGVGGLPQLSLGIIGLGAALILMATSLKIISTIPSDQLMSVVLAFGAMVGILAVASGVLSIAGKGLLIFANALVLVGLGLIAIGASLVVGSVGLLMLVGTFALIGDQLTDFLEPVKAIAEASLSLIAAGASLAIFGLGAAVVGLAALVAGVGILAFAGALTLLGSINIPNLLTNLELLIDGLSEMAPKVGEAGANTIDGFTKSMQAKMPSIGSMAVTMAVSLIHGLTSGIKENSSMLGDSIGELILGIGGVIITLGENLLSCGRDILGKIIEGILNAIGIDVPDSVKEFVTNFTDGIGSAINNFLGIGQEAGDAVGEGVEKSSNEAGESGTNMAKSIADGIESGTPDAKDAASSLGEGVTSSFTESFNSDSIGASVGDAVGNITTSLEDGRGDITSVAKSFGPAFSDGLGEGIDGTKMANGVKEAVGTSIKSGKEKAKDAKSIGKEMAEAAGKGASENKSNAEQGGRDVGDGLVNGIKSKLGAAGSAGYNLGQIALRKAKEAVDSKSPSKKFHKLGVDIDKGLILGIESFMNKVGDSGTDLGEAVIDSTSKTLKTLSNLTDGLDMAPTIRPVVDLSGIQDGINSANAIFADSSMLNANLALSSTRFYDPNSASVNRPSKQINNTISIQLDYSAGADANQIVRDIAAGLMNQAFMEG